MATERLWAKADLWTNLPLPLRGKLRMGHQKFGIAVSDSPLFTYRCQVTVLPFDKLRTARPVNGLELCYFPFWFIVEFAKLPFCARKTARSPARLPDKIRFSICPAAKGLPLPAGFQLTVLRAQNV